MTQEEIQQKAYEVYPLDLDRHMIIEGEPYDNNKEKREAYIRGLTDSKPSLPSDLDEAAEEYLRQYNKSEFGNGGDDWDDDICITFKAGAEWMAGQGITVIKKIRKIDDGFNQIPTYCNGFEVTELDVSFLNSKECGYGDEVIVQIRKK